MNLEKLHRVSVRLSRRLAADALYLTILALAIFVWFEMTVVYATLMVINDRWPAWICAPMFITQACFIVFTMAGYGLALDTPHEALRPMTDVGASELKLSPSVPPSESPEPSVTPESFLRRMKFAPLRRRRLRRGVVVFDVSTRLRGVRHLCRERRQERRLQDPLRRSRSHAFRRRALDGADGVEAHEQGPCRARERRRRQDAPFARGDLAEDGREGRRRAVRAHP